ncbi:MAG: protein kinase [Myxococcaceae bacterium]
MCPDENTLQKFANGQLTEMTALEAHLDGCEACRRAVAAAASDATLPAQLPSSTLSPGQRVARYEVERELGRGGMGVVYQARDVTLDRRVALKILHARRDEAAQARLLREAQVMAKLTHPNVVPVFELGEWKNDLYLVMELVPGVTLEAWLKREKHRRRDIVQAFLAAGRGLAAAHAAGVVHRDFKPANVLMGLDGRVRVTDFGLSRPGPALELPATDSALVTRDGSIVGTLAYMSPEQLDGKTADERSDQFSFCVSLVEALQGTRPFKGEKWTELAKSVTEPPSLSGVPRAMRSVLKRGLAHDPAHRYGSLTALLNALERSQQLGWGAVGVTGTIAAMVSFLFVAPPAWRPAALLGFDKSAQSITFPDEDLVPVVIASRDIKAGTVVEMEMLAQRVMPKPFVTQSVIRPDSVSYIVGQKLNIDVYTGDVLTWPQFETVEDAKKNAAAEEERLPVVVAAHDLPAGTVVTADMLMQRQLPRQFATTSIVKPDALSYVLGQKLLVDVQAGDLVLWSQFETSKQQSGEELVTVLTAADNVPEGATLSPDRIVHKQVPKSLATKSVLRPQQTPHVWGHPLLANLKKGDLLLWSQLSKDQFTDDGLDSQTIANQAERLSPLITDCAKSDPAPPVKFSVRADGSLFDVRVNTENATLKDCVLRALEKEKLPSAKHATWDVSLTINSVP